jgi:hypothetical protein
MVDSITGEVMVRKDLAADSSTQYSVGVILKNTPEFYRLVFQLSIEATDMGVPPKSSSNNARVNVRVTRNLNSPRFDAGVTVVDITRDHTVNGAEVMRFTARDDDGTVRSSDYVKHS